MPSKNIIVIGSGFSSLSCACFLAKKGYNVTVLEKNETLGGRARKFETNGFVFDMGPSWYWMPDVFESFFAKFGKKVADYYDLVRLDPSYAVIWDNKDKWDIPASFDELCQLFESYEKGAGENLKKFMAEAEYKYEVGINDLVYKPSESLLEFADLQLLKGILKLDVFKSFSSHAHHFFKHPKLLQLIEFPVLFLGATPQNTPALYSLMNYADIKLGTWYPMGGMFKIIEAMVSLAKELGVNFITNQNVQKIEVVNQKVSVVKTQNETYLADAVVGGADYHHIDSSLLDANYRNYSEQYWNNRTMAPSSLIFYLGVNKKVSKLLHHNLFFDESFLEHAVEIYDKPAWPKKPLFYVCCPSKTDSSVAPEGSENLFILIPVAPDLKDIESIRENYYQMVMNRLESFVGEEIKPFVVYKKSYAHNDFIADYNAFKGNAYGLANTLSQTAILKPQLKSKKVKNLYYTGQLTVPGPGVPPSLISGEVVAKELIKEFKN